MNSLNPGASARCAAEDEGKTCAVACSPRARTAERTATAERIAKTTKLFLLFIRLSEIQPEINGLWRRLTLACLLDRFFYGFLYGFLDYFLHGAFDCFILQHIITRLGDGLSDGLLNGGGKWI